MTASFNNCLACSRPATSSHLTLGFSLMMAPDRAALNLAASGSSPSSSLPLVLSCNGLLGPGHAPLDAVAVFTTRPPSVLPPLWSSASISSARVMYWFIFSRIVSFVRWQSRREQATWWAT